MWFEAFVACLVLLPIPLAIMDTASEMLLPEVRAWRKARASDPTFPPTFYQYIALGQTSSVPADERLTPALPDESRERLDAVRTLCLNDFSELWGALAGLETASRHFVAAVHAPGKVEQLVAFDMQRLDKQRRLRTASCAFLAALLDFARQLHAGDRGTVAALHPHASLEAPFEALEALYPEVVARRHADLARIAR